MPDPVTCWAGAEYPLQYRPVCLHCAVVWVDVVTIYFFVVCPNLFFSHCNICDERLLKILNLNFKLHPSAVF